jgi:hypothetical protein
MDKPPKPTLVDPSVYDELKRRVSIGRYVEIASAKDVPMRLADGIICFRYCMAMASTGVPSFTFDPGNRGIEAVGTIFDVRLFRSDEGGPEPHINVDDHIFFQTRSGDCWTAHVRPDEIHYQKTMTEAGLSDIAGVRGLPPAPEGTLEEYRKHCQVNMSGLWVKKPNKTE